LTPFSIIDTQYESVCLSRCVFYSFPVSNIEKDVGRDPSQGEGGGSTHKQSRDFIEDIDDFTGCRALVHCFSRHGDTCLRGSETFARLFAEEQCISGGNIIRFVGRVR
jgi:hypothetical protein